MKSRCLFFSGMHHSLFFLIEQNFKMRRAGNLICKSLKAASLARGFKLPSQYPFNNLSIEPSFSAQSRRPHAYPYANLGNRSGQRKEARTLLVGSLVPEQQKAYRFYCNLHVLTAVALEDQRPWYDRPLRRSFSTGLQHLFTEKGSQASTSSLSFTQQRKERRSFNSKLRFTLWTSNRRHVSHWSIRKQTAV